MDNLIADGAHAPFRKDHLPVPYVRSSPQLQPEPRLNRSEIIVSIRPDDPGVIPLDENFYDCAPCPVIGLNGSRFHLSHPSYLQRICFKAYKETDSLLREDPPTFRIDLSW